MTDAHGLMRDGLGISFGNDVSDDLELRICGDVRGKRVLELGIFGPMPNCVTLARKGARVTSVDTQRDTIQRARHSANEFEVSVEFHESGHADLGMMMSGTVDLAVSIHQIDTDTDVARLFRQVHRVLKPEAGFIFALGHPAAAIFDRAPAISSAAAIHGRSKVPCPNMSVPGQAKECQRQTPIRSCSSIRFPRTIRSGS